MGSLDNKNGIMRLMGCLMDIDMKEITTEMAELEVICYSKQGVYSRRRRKRNSMITTANIRVEMK